MKNVKIFCNKFVTHKVLKINTLISIVTKEQKIYSIISYVRNNKRIYLHTPYTSLQLCVITFILFDLIREIFCHSVTIDANYLKTKYLGVAKVPLFFGTITPFFVTPKNSKHRNNMQQFAYARTK